MNARVSSSFRNMPCSQLGDATAFPKFKFELKPIPICHDPKLCKASKFTEHMFSEGTVSLFPYTQQSAYDRSQQTQQLPCIVLENDLLKVTVYPQYGGRIASVFDKIDERELLFDNPVFQPANLAIRDAWFSGGIEWNNPMYGHNPLTCSDVYVARIDSTASEGLRIYEFDRNLHTAWQVDLHLDEATPKLWIHVKVLNVSDKDIDYYWWTNVAVPEMDETRVLASTKNKCVSHTVDQRVTPGEFPYLYDFDGSYPARYPRADSIFFDLHEDRMPWIASVDKDGKGLVYTSTQDLCGRKFFAWGSNPGGRRWMDFLSQDGKGRYIEIQGGLQPTQLQTIPLAADEAFEWTECISSLSMNSADAHSEDYMHATRTVQDLLDKNDAEKLLQQRHAVFTNIAARAVHENIWAGSAWGRLFEQRTGQPLSGSMMFDAKPSPGEEVWFDLLEGKGLADGEVFGDWVHHKLWTDLLEQEIASGRGHWKHYVLLAAAAINSENFTTARELLNQAMADQPTAVGWRLLAVVQTSCGDVDGALESYANAWSLHQYDDLAVVYARLLWEHGRKAECEALIAAIPGAVRAHERIQILEAEIAAETGDYDLVEKILQREFIGNREGEVTLSDLWYRVQIKRAEQGRGSAFSKAEISDFKSNHNPPKEIDFRMFVPVSSNHAS